MVADCSRRRRFDWFGRILILIICTPAWLLGQDGEEPPFRYDLRKGDHLVYRQVLHHFLDNRSMLGQKGSDGKPLYQLTDLEEMLKWTTHVVVLDSGPEGSLIGIQRTLDDAQLVRFEVAGEDRTERRRSVLESTAAGRGTFAEAVRLDPYGNPIQPWVVVREWTGKVLFEVHEFLPLPPLPVRAGLRWSVPGYRTFDYEVVGREEVDGENCLLVSGSSLSTDPARSHNIRLAYNYCATSGLMRQLRFEGLYLGGLFQDNRDQVTLELVSRERDQTMESWLADRSVRLAVLEALALPGSPAVEPSRLLAMLEDPELPSSRDLILGVLIRKGLFPTDPGRLEELSGDSDPLLRRLALQILLRKSEEGSRVLERVSADPDIFVRAIAAQRDSGEGEPGRRFPAELREACSASFSRSDPRPEVRAGTYLEVLGIPGLEEWPFVVQVPIDYLGDRPFPLLIYLSGNGGSAVEGMQIGQAAFARTGYLAVFPQASGYWWDEAPASAFARLLPELKRRYNIDTDRIYLTGLSNGGTGTFFYAAYWPQDFTAAVSAMGAGFWPLNVDEVDEVFPENLGNLPLLFLHGERDRTIHPDTTRNTVSRLKWRRAPLESHYFENLGHGVVVEVRDEGRTLDFFERFASRPFPRTIRFGMRNLKYPRHYWTQVLEGGKGVMRVEGDIGDDNTIRLKARNVRRLRLLLRPDLFPVQGPIRVVLNGKEVFSGPLPTRCETLAQSFEMTRDPVLSYSAALDFAVP